MEHTQRCGFSARLVTGFTGRAIVSRSLGRQPEARVAGVLQKLRRDTAACLGSKQHVFAPSAAAQHATQDLYYAIAALEEQQPWRSAVKSAFSKMEYAVPSAAMLTHLLLQQPLPPCAPLSVLPLFLLQLCPIQTRRRWRTRGSA